MSYQIILNSLSEEVFSLIAEIDEFKERWNVLKTITPHKLSSLREIATIASIGSSTRIEGVKLTNEQIEKLLLNIEKKSFRSRDEEEIGGYADTMNMVFESYQEISISENHIKQLHKNLLKYSSKDERHKGEYKKFSNRVEAFDPNGKSIGIIFETATPFNTPLYIGDLIEWYSTQITGTEYHPLIVIGTFVVHFLAIHPFQDGNGRLSRILTTLMLLKKGYSYVPFCSLESIVEENKEQYYLTLRKAQNSFKSDHAFLNDWIIYFLKMLKKQKDLLESRFKVDNTLPFKELNKTDDTIIALIKEHKKLTTSEIAALSGLNRNTVKKYLKKLCDNELIKLHGVKKGSWYGEI